MLNGTKLQRFQRLGGQRELAVLVTRKAGKFGMGHDERNVIMAVHPEGAAADAGLRVGDAVRTVNGVPLVGLLSASLQGKETVELRLLREPPKRFAWCDLKALEIGTRIK